MAITSRLAAAFGLLALFALSTPASAQLPDVIVYDVGVDGGNQNDIAYYGQSGGIAAYSIATQSCNKGTATLDWFTGGSTLHPVIAQNMFRLKDGRFEQLGYSWLKHGFCAVNEVESSCGSCSPTTPCSNLGVGCADTYWATLNDGAGGQSKKNVNAATGAHTHGGSPSGPGAIRGRLQVAVSDVDPAQNAGASYFIESQYVTQDDAEAGNATNNASWRPVQVVSVSNIDGAGPTQREKPAIYAWRDADPMVAVMEVKNVEGTGIKTTFFLATRVTDLGNGMWHYEYALQNLNSDQSAGSFSVPVVAGLSVSNIGFRDVNSHSGDPYDNTDWAGIEAGSQVSWATTPHSSNVNANAIRWGTLYNFRFDAPAPPVSGTVNIGLFKPSINTDINVDGVLIPGDPPVCGATASNATRTGGLNLSAYSATPAILGGSVSITVNPGTAHTFAVVKAFAAPQNLTLPSGFVRLFNPGSAFYFKINVALPAIGITFPIPNDQVLCGLTAYSQALMTGGGAGLAWTNSVDITAGL